MRVLSTLASLLAGVPYLGDLPYFHTGLTSPNALPQNSYSHPHPHPHHGSARPLVSHRLRDRLESIRERWAMRGFVVAVVASPEYTGHGWASEVLPFGEADHRGNPVTEDSLFAIASNSKLFTAISVGLLIENHTRLPNGELLAWSTKVRDVLPEWQLMDGYASEHVDVVDLLNMRSGMPRHDNAKGPASPSSLVATMRHLRPSTEIRQEFQYNNLHYTALSHIIPTLTGVPYIEYVQEHIFDPLGMNATYDSIKAGKSGRRTEGFSKQGRNKTLCAEEWEAQGKKQILGHGHQHEHNQGETHLHKLKAVPKSCVGEVKSLGWWTQTDGIFEAGPGGVILSGNDMASTQWLRELLDPQVLPREVMSRITLPRTVMETMRRLPELSASSYGLAQWMYSYRGHKTEGHGGDVPGQESLMVRLPDDGLGIFIATNDNEYGSQLAQVVQFMILDEMLGLDPLDWEDRIMGPTLTSLPKYPDAPSNPRPPPSEHAVAATYHNPGYGDMTLVPFHLNSSRSVCGLTSDMFVSAISSAGTPLNITGPIYVAEINKVFTSHLVFTHCDGNLFNWTGLSVYDSPSGPGAHVVTIDKVGEAVVTGEGIGMFGNWWGAGEAVPKVHAREGEDVKVRAEVWYDKVAAA